MCRLQNTKIELWTAWIPVKPNDISYLQFPPSHKILVPLSIENIALRWRPLLENQLVIGLWIMIENCYTQSVTLDLLNRVCTKECHNMGVDKTLMHQEPARTTNIHCLVVFLIWNGAIKGPHTDLYWFLLKLKEHKCPSSSSFAMSASFAGFLSKAALLRAAKNLCQVLFSFFTWKELYR